MSRKRKHSVENPNVRPRPSHAPGSALKALLNQYGLFGNDAAKVAAHYLGYTPETIQALMCRKIRMNDFELLQYKMIEYYIDKVTTESRLSKYGPIREDGKRHRSDDWPALKELHKANNRDYMRRKRMENPNLWRKPKNGS